MFDAATPSPTDPQLAWRVIPVRAGETVRGWLAGPPVGIESHNSGSTKPCRSWITKGQVPCYYGAKCVRRFVSYVPIWTLPDEEKWVIIVSKGVALKFPDWTNTRVGCPVSFKRPKTKNNPPLQVSWEGGYDFPERISTKLSKRKANDIKPYLLHLWQDETVCRHCGVSFIPSVATEQKQRELVHRNGSMGS